jgi:hypothetical protein
LENIKKYFIEKSKYFPLKLLIGKSIFLPISIILTIVPLIVHSKSVDLDIDTQNIYGKSSQTDLFAQYKASFLLFFSVILIIIAVISFKKIFKKKDKTFNLILIGAAVFWIFSLFSAIFSSHKNYAFFGAYDRAEGLITITCYMILFVYSAYTFKSTNNYKYIIIPILILVAILSFLGVFQYFGHDLINSKLGLFLVTGRFTGKMGLVYAAGKLYGTLPHYDYVGSFVPIVLPILALLTICEKRIIYKIALFIGVLLSLWLLFGSTSRSGLIGIAFSFILVAIFFGKFLFRIWKPILIGIIFIGVLAIGLNAITKGEIFQRIPSLITDTASLFKDTSDFDYKDYTIVRDIKYVDGHSEIILPNDTIKVSYENEHYVFKNSNNQIINYTNNNDTFTITDSNFKEISFTSKKANSNGKIANLYLNINNKDVFIFGVRKNNTIQLIDPDTQNYIDLASPEVSKFLIGKEKLGPSRGYIWSRSIPLIKNNLIIASGPDTFIYEFPQNDLLGKYYSYNTPYMLVDKPHNLYLQIALNNGLISLIGFLAMIFFYLIDCFKLYALKKHYEYSQFFGIAVCLSIVGYLFAGFFNDSVVAVSTIFWIILGVGVSINFINRKALINN